MIMQKRQLLLSRVSQRLIGLNFVNDPYVIVKKLTESNLLFFSAYHRVKSLSKVKQFASTSV